MNEESHRKRAAILQQIDNFQRKNRGRSPTIRELMKLCRISSTSVLNYHLEWLIRNGYLEKIPQISRGIVGVTEAGLKFIQPESERREFDVELLRHIRETNPTKRAD